MKYLVLMRDAPGATDDAFMALAEAEARAAWDLQQAGHIREIHFRADRNDAVLTLEAADDSGARAILGRLPLVAAGLLEYELIPLRAYPGYARLFRPETAPVAGPGGGVCDAPAARKAIGIDIDGVLTDTIRHSASFLSDRIGQAISAWDIIHGWTGIPHIDDYFENYGYELLGTLPPYAHAVEVIAGLCAQTQVYLVSARGEYNRQVTEAWLDQHAIRPHRVILTGGGGKLSVCDLHGIGIFVEDSPLNARELANAGLPVLLLDTEYNRYLEHPGVTRCRDWPEIGRHLAAFLAGGAVPQS